MTTKLAALLLLTVLCCQGASKAEKAAEKAAATQAARAEAAVAAAKKALADQLAAGQAKTIEQVQAASAESQAAVAATKKALADQLASTQAQLQAARAESQAAVAAARKDREALERAIAAVGTNAKIQARAATVQRSESVGLALEKTAEADAQADSNAAIAQRAVDVAEQADARAVIAAMSAKAQADQLMKVSDHNNSALYMLVFTTVFGFLALLYKDVILLLKDNRTRKWDIEDRVRIDKETKEHRAYELDEIAKVGKAAAAAYSEANTVNQKIESIGLKMQDNRPLAPAEAKPEAAKALKAKRSGATEGGG